MSEAADEISNQYQFRNRWYFCSQQVSSPVECIYDRSNIRTANDGAGDRSRSQLCTFELISPVDVLRAGIMEDLRLDVLLSEYVCGSPGLTGKLTLQYLSL